MIILPDRSISRSKLFMPVPKREWMPPSVSQRKDEFGNENRTYFRIKARLNDGFTKWTGWFEDREDFDAFSYALLKNSLRQETALWDLPNVSWDPYIGENLSYEFATVTFFTTAGSATYTSPSDWDNSNNTIEGIGGGGSGGASVVNGLVSRSSGGGGGEYRKIANFNFANPGTTTASYTVGSGNAAKTATSRTGAATPGAAGTDTTFNTTSLVAKAGGGGGAVLTATNTAGGTGGTGGTGADGNFDGGSGGGANANSTATGGGGAAGPLGTGGNGGTTATGSVRTSGGTGGGGFGGTAGSNGGNGGNGTEFQVSPARGSGGGGGGNRTVDNNVTAGNGGLYGAGGGGATINTEGALSRTATSGAGRQGLIVITYEPALPPNLNSLGNLPMLGM